MPAVHESDSRARSLSLPPLAWLIAIAAAIAMLGILTLLLFQLAVLKDSRRHIAAQDAKITRLLRGTTPVLERAKPLAGELVPLVRRAGPLVDALRQIDPEGVGASLDAAGMSLNAAGRLALSLSAGERLVRVVDQSGSLLDALARAGYLGRALRAADLAPYIARVLRDTLAIQRDTLATGRTSLAVQQRTATIQARTFKLQLRLFAIQREALAHIRSIDRKTGGQLPAKQPAP